MDTRSLLGTTRTLVSRSYVMILAVCVGIEIEELSFSSLSHCAC